MVTLRCKKSGYEVEGELVKKTSDCYVLRVPGGMKLYRIDEWEVVKNETMGSAEGTRGEPKEGV